MFKVKTILKAPMTAKSCNAVHYLRGMHMYDFMMVVLKIFLLPAAEENFQTPSHPKPLLYPVWF